MDPVRRTLSASLIVFGLTAGGYANADRTLVYDAQQRALDYLALAHGAGNGDLILVRGLLARGAPPNARPVETGRSVGDAEYLAAQIGSPLQRASESGHLAVVELLLDSGADPNWTCCSGETALYFAAREGHRDVAVALVLGGADPSRAVLSLANDGFDEALELLESLNGSRR